MGASVKQKRAHRPSRSDFLFTIGYQGSVAIVDRTAQRRYGRLTVDELLERGLYKPALSAAEYDCDQDAKKKVLRSYNEQAVAPLFSVEQIRARFGVFGVPESVTGVEQV